MPTSVAGTCSNRQGFTLLELLLVLVILAGVAAVAAPRLAVLGEYDSRSSARSMATLLRYLDERSVTARIPYRLTINLDEQSVFVQQKNIFGELVQPDDPFLSRNPLQGSTQITGLRTDRTGSIKSGTLAVDYGSGGLGEALVVYLETPGKVQYTVQALPVNGSVKVAEGYLELIR